MSDDLKQINEQLNIMHEKYGDIDVREIPFKDMWDIIMLYGMKDYLTHNDFELKKKDAKMEIDKKILSEITGQEEFDFVIPLSKMSKKDMKELMLYWRNRMVVMQECIKDLKIRIERLEKACNINEGYQGQDPWV